MNHLKFLSLLVLAAMFSATAAAQTFDDYKLVWSDEFNGTTLDTDAWNIEQNGDGGGNAELQYYLADNVSIGKEPTSGESCLILTAKKQSYGGKQFTSGRLNTHNKVYLTHGMIESRIKLPKTANGLWPAFWMLGNDYETNPWPRCGEIDILEMGNADGIGAGTQDRYFNGACHWGYYKGSAYPNYARSSTCSYSLQDGEFHLFTLVWDDDYVAMYVDRDKYPTAEPYYKMGVSDYTDDWSTGNYFHHEFFIVYDLAVGGYFTGILSPSGITALDSGDAKMYIDYVRVYKKQGDDWIEYPSTYTYIISPSAHYSSASRPTYYSLDGRHLTSSNHHSLIITRDASGTRKIINGEF